MTDCTIVEVDNASAATIISVVLFVPTTTTTPRDPSIPPLCTLLPSSLRNKSPPRCCNCRPRRPSSYPSSSYLDRYDGYGVINIMSTTYPPRTCRNFGGCSSSMLAISLTRTLLTSTTSQSSLFRHVGYNSLSL